MATDGGRSVLLARDTTLIIAGPSGVGKSLVGLFDLGGRLAADEPSKWLGLNVHARLHVLALSYEGSAEDTAERLEALVPESARERMALLNRFDRGAPDLRADLAHRQQLADLIRAHAADVVVVDTGAAFFGGVCDISKGIPEEAHAVLEDLRARSGCPFACIVIAHTKKADRSGARVDELEEISGTFPRKADSAIVLRRDGEESPRRHVRFAKVRRGPEPRSLIASFPDESNEPPRLEVRAETGRPVKEGTEAESIAEWIRRQDEPPVIAQITAALGISEATLRRRRGELEGLGIRHARPAGRGNTYAYGSEDQWARMQLGVAS